MEQVEIFGYFMKQKKKERSRSKKISDRLIKIKVVRESRTSSEQQEEDYYKPKKVSNFYNYNYIEFETNCDRYRKLSLDEYPNKIKPYWRDIIIDLQNFDTWKI